MKKVFSTAVLVFLFTFLSINLFAQDDLYDLFSNEDKVIWNDGELMLSGKKNIKGKVNLSFKFDAVRIIEDDNKDQIRTYTASKVDYISYIDNETKERRVFYSLPYTDEETKYSGPTFFELVKDVNDFALLSRLHYKYINAGKYSIGGGSSIITTPSWAVTPSGVSTFIVENEYDIENKKLYFINRKGEIIPYVVVKANDNLNQLKHLRIMVKSRQYINENAFEEMTGSLYKECVEYAKRNSFDLKNEEDLVMVLGFYESMK